MFAIILKEQQKFHQTAAGIYKKRRLTGQN
jgi:hypothetical protein